MNSTARQLALGDDMSAKIEQMSHNRSRSAFEHFQQRLQRAAATAGRHNAHVETAQAPMMRALLLELIDRN